MPMTVWIWLYSSWKLIYFTIRTNKIPVLFVRSNYCLIFITINVFLNLKKARIPKICRWRHFGQLCKIRLMAFIKDWSAYIVSRNKEKLCLAFRVMKLSFWYINKLNVNELFSFKEKLYVFLEIFVKFAFLQI